MIAFATDEAIALRASADFGAICPTDQTLASGSDGVFSTADRWTLHSASVDFGSLGLAPGSVIRLSKPTSSFGPGGELFGVGPAGPGSLTLRRKGQPPGVGQPPAPPTGLSGVEFSIRTLAPQIGAASADLARRLGIDEHVPGRRSVDLLDPGQLREATVLAVLARQYLDQARRFAAGSDGPEDWYSAKSRIMKAELDEVLDRLTLRWRAAEPADLASQPARFGARISR